MFSKRVRNKKLEINKQYPAYFEDQLESSILLEYTQISLKTGVEQEEEKEVHLKKLLENGKGDIVVPLVNFTDDHVKELDTYKLPTKYIKHKKDVPNAYILQQEDYEYLKDENIKVCEFKKITSLIGKKEYETLQDSTVKQKVTDYYFKKVVKMVGNDDYDAYLCFRKRTNMLGRKNRRSETTTLEKLKRIYIEFWYINKLLEHKNKEQELNEEILAIDYKISEAILKLKSDYSLSKRKKMYNRLYRSDAYKKALPFYKTCRSFTDLLNDRKKIYELKKTLLNPKKPLSKEEIETEVEVLSRFCMKEHSDRK